MLSLWKLSALFLVLLHPNGGHELNEEVDLDLIQDKFSMNAQGFYTKQIKLVWPRVDAQKVGQL